MSRNTNLRSVSFAESSLIQRYIKMQFANIFINNF